MEVEVSPAEALREMLLTFKLQRELSNHEVARMLGISNSKISEWVNMKSFPRKKDLAKLQPVTALPDLMKLWHLHRARPRGSARVQRLVCSANTRACLTQLKEFCGQLIAELEKRPDAEWSDDDYVAWHFADTVVNPKGYKTARADT
jgi:transcriptional regulator with XRE-family HTH domain